MNFVNIIIINFEIFLNVLEQFAIRVTIFGIDIEDLINYVNKVYFNDSDDFVSKFVGKPINNIENINPQQLIQQFRDELENELKPSVEKLVFCNEIIFILRKSLRF